MNGIGGGGVTYHSEDDYDDNMYTSSGMVVGNLGGMSVGGNMGKMQLASSMPSYSNSGNSGGLGLPSGGPLSSLHGMTNPAHMIPPLQLSSTGMPIPYLGVSHATNMTGMHGATSNAVPTTSGGSGSRSQNNICCLIDDGRKCHRNAGNASYSKRVQKTVFHKRLRLENDTHAQHIYICDYHKMIIQNARTRQKKESDEDVNDGNPDDIPEVDLYQLQVNTLRRYKKHYKISSRPGLNKAQLADILMRHFKTIPVQEKEIVTYFIYMVKSERNKLDNNNRPAPEPTPSTSTQSAASGDYMYRE